MALIQDQVDGLVKTLQRALQNTHSSVPCNTHTHTHSQITATHITATETHTHSQITATHTNTHTLTDHCNTHHCNTNTLTDHCNTHHCNTDTHTDHCNTHITATHTHHTHHCNTHPHTHTHPPTHTRSRMTLSYTWPIRCSETFLTTIILPSEVTMATVPEAELWNKEPLGVQWEPR